MSLPTDYKARKNLPIGTGVIDYFPDALAEVAHCSKVGNDQHNPGEPLHWAKEKSADEADALIRHFVQRGTVDSDGVRHSAKVAWRALALLQREIDAEERVRKATAKALERARNDAFLFGSGAVYIQPGALNRFDEKPERDAFAKFNRDLLGPLIARTGRLLADPPVTTAKFYVDKGDGVIATEDRIVPMYGRSPATEALPLLKTLARRSRAVLKRRVARKGRKS